MRRSPPPGRLESALSLARTPGGFRLRGRGGIELTARAAPEGWIVEGTGDPRGWFLRKDPPDSGGGFVLVRGSAPQGEVAARSYRIAGTRSGGCGAHLVAEDGRLFVIEQSFGRDVRVDLRSWEAPGAYFRAHPTERAWRVTRTAAGQALPDAETILVLFAAEIADADRLLTEARRD